MDQKRYVIMGAGEVGRHLARTLSVEGHAVTLIDSNPAKRQLVEEQLDVGFVLGNGSHVPTLEAAEVGACDLFVAVSSSDEANLVASLLAKKVGASRTVVRVATSEYITKYGSTYEKTFGADLLLSTQLLTTTQILNNVLGYNTIDIEYLARGALQVRRTTVEAGSILHERRLADVDLPKDCLVLAFLSSGRLQVPTGNDRAQPGDDALVLGTTEAIDELERRVSGHSLDLGLVVIAGGGSTAQAVAQGLEGHTKRLKIIESDRTRAELLAAEFPNYEIIHGDATDMSALAAEGVGKAQTFIALTGHDETNLMACLLAQELGARRMTALVRKSETSSLWHKVALLDVVSPRSLAAERIRSYIDSNYESHIISFENASAQFIQRRVYEHSPAAGGRLADIEIPQGLIVAAILRNGKAIIPRGDDKLQVGDAVVLFVDRSEAGTASLLFPGVDEE
ncbi:MAG: Trk system potassium transporter TrkA [Myxococcales bacterium]|nr:Trk system potassium transporter TrkA [Myxococcales bacterium]